jgi:ribose transport system ATP-binding protein
LFRLVRACVAEGASVIFVSHDVDEVREITDRATILRDGKLIDTIETAGTSHEAFVERIIGRNMTSYAGEAKRRPDAPALVEVENLAAPGLGPLSLSLAPGEILGLTGLIGAGYDVVPAAIYGARQATGGQMRLAEDSLRLADVTPEDSLHHGIVYLPADRLGAAGVGSLPVSDNVGLPVLSRLKRAFGLLDADIRDHAARLGARSGVTPNAPALPLSSLSGGNAQKALLSKWLQIEPRLMLLDEPTQGVDVGARQDIWEALDRAAAGGTAILIGSTDYEQLARLCHRVLVMARGQIVGELTGSALTKEAIAEACFRSTTLSAATAA